MRVCRLCTLHPRSPFHAAVREEDAMHAQRRRRQTQATESELHDEYMTSRDRHMETGGPDGRERSTEVRTIERSGPLVLLGERQVHESMT